MRLCYRLVLIKLGYRLPYNQFIDKYGIEAIGLDWIVIHLSQRTEMEIVLKKTNKDRKVCELFKWITGPLERNRHHLVLSDICPVVSMILFIEFQMASLNVNGGSTLNFSTVELLSEYISHASIRTV